MYTFVYRTFIKFIFFCRGQALDVPGCKLRRHLYEAKYAQNEYEAVRSESRQGFAISSEELKRIDGIISPLIKQGQSIHQICVNNVDLIMLDEKTIYNYTFLPGTGTGANLGKSLMNGFLPGRVDAPFARCAPPRNRTCGFPASGSLRNALFNNYHSYTLTYTLPLANW